MSTKTVDRDGNVVRESDTKVPKDGVYAPRDEHGKRLRGAEQTPPEKARKPEKPAVSPATPTASGSADKESAK